MTNRETPRLLLFGMQVVASYNIRVIILGDHNSYLNRYVNLKGFSIAC